ncbi:MAG TPA: DUF885 domain-containing protein [Trebonia sp.]|nr:DUF885 domain-containing protein [Trebonia sp.]
MSEETVPDQAGHAAAAGDELRRLADEYVDDLARRHPDAATELGDHRFDELLPDRSEAALADERRALDAFAGRLTDLDMMALEPELRVDAAMMAGDVARRLFEIEELREQTWNPLQANPGMALYMLLARDYAPLPDRLHALAGRLAQVPDALAAARGSLGLMPQVHLETAITQFNGTIALVTEAAADGGADAAAASAAAAEVGRARPAALEALVAHRDWLAGRLAELSAAGQDAFADPRLGPELFNRKLALTLQGSADADAVLARAEADLERLTGEITRVAAGLGGTPREVLDRLGAAGPDEATILAFCADALVAQTAFVREHNLITVYDDPVELIDMPEINRGVAVAYCDPPGPLESAPLPTFIAVSPTPADWSAERVASFYREYNRHMVHNLMVHEAMPGHYLQLAHARRFAGSTRVRAALWSGSFVEGWAVYTEELMAEHGYPGEGDPDAVRMQQLKMQLRMVINAILDARVHAHGMTEAQALALMTERGFQEEGEAAGKWRRAQLTSAQLSTYYVGYTEISDLAGELAKTGLEPRAMHDQMLAHGSPPVRLLRTLL